MLGDPFGAMDASVISAVAASDMTSVPNESVVRGPHSKRPVLERLAICNESCTATHDDDVIAHELYWSGGAQKAPQEWGYYVPTFPNDSCGRAVDGIRHLGPRPELGSYICRDCDKNKYREFLMWKRSEVGAQLSISEFRQGVLADAHAATIQDTHTTVDLGTQQHGKSDNAQGCRGFSISNIRCGIQRILDQVGGVGKGQLCHCEIRLEPRTEESWLACLNTKR